jgi:SAM-dependent methyltransferase
MDIKQKETIEAYNNSAKDFMKKMGTIKNYNTPYKYLLEKLKENNNVLDLACGPCQIGKYIREKINVNITGVDLSREMLKIAENNIPDGVFIEDSIITFKNTIFYDMVIIGFGIPYLNEKQVEKCIENSISLLKVKGYMYVSFMDGNKEGFASTAVNKGSGFSGEIIWNIYAPRGTQMMYAEPFSAFGHGGGLNWDGISKQTAFGREAEMIVQRGANYKITKMEKKGNKLFMGVEIHPEKGYEIIQQNPADWKGSTETFK